jgi:hypothetical protein
MPTAVRDRVSENVHAQPPAGARKLRVLWSSTDLVVRTSRIEASETEAHPPNPDLKIS